MYCGQGPEECERGRQMEARTRAEKEAMRWEAWNPDVSRRKLLRVLRQRARTT